MNASDGTDTTEANQVDEASTSESSATKGVVYFIQAGPRGPIKIGYTTRMAEKRIRDFSTGCPYELFLLGTIQCEDFRAREKELHDRFAALRISHAREWFRWSPEILKVIGMTKAAEEAETKRMIDAARELLKPTPVKLGHIPRWFSSAIRPMRIREWYGLEPVYQTLYRLSGPGGFLDHWGSTKITIVSKEYVAFCSEPYSFDSRYSAVLDEVKTRTGMRWQLESNSWHYPGRTHRILILPPETGPHTSPDDEPADEEYSPDATP